MVGLSLLGSGFMLSPPFGVVLARPGGCVPLPWGPGSHCDAPPSPCQVVYPSAAVTQGARHIAHGALHTAQAGDESHLPPG